MQNNEDVVNALISFRSRLLRLQSGERITKAIVFFSFRCKFLVHNLGFKFSNKTCPPSYSISVVLFTSADPMSSYFWNLKCVQNNKESVKTLLAYEQCCGFFSPRVGTLLLTFMSFLFNFCIIAFDWLAVHFLLEPKPHSNISTARPFVTSHNTTSADSIFPWLDEQFLSLWILIPCALVLIVSFVGFVGALFKWSVFLIPYCVYRFCWFLLVLLFFLPFLFVESLILIVLSLFPVCPYFLVVFTWIVYFFENVLLAIVASEVVIIVLEFHMMSVVFGCYLECTNKSRRVEELPEVFDGDASEHVVIEVEKQKSYRSIEHRV